MAAPIYDSAKAAPRDAWPAGVLEPPSGGRWRLRRWAPTEALAPFVTWAWLVEWELPAGTSHDQVTLPHPSAHVVVEQGRVEIAGPARSAFHRTLCNRGRAVALRLRPGALRPWLGRSVATVAGQTLPAREVLPALDEHLGRHIEATDDGDAAIARLCGAVTTAADLRGDPRIDRAEAAVDRIASDPAIGTVDALAAATGLARRSLQRLFTEWVGLSVKSVIRRYRLQEAAARARGGTTVDWAELAANLGYYDQSHLIRDFTRCLGRPPARFARG